MDRRALAVASSLTGLLVVVPLLAGPAGAQGTPLPVPGAPGGGQPPIYSEPAPTAPKIESPHVAPLRPRPEPDASGARGPSEPAAQSVTAAPGAPRVTAFPELTQGIGNSQALLED